jgi:hypothetical protein
MFRHMKLGMEVPAALKVYYVSNPTGGFGSRRLKAASDLKFLRILLAFPPIAVLGLMTQHSAIFPGIMGLLCNPCSSCDADLSYSDSIGQHVARACRGEGAEDYCQAKAKSSLTMVMLASFKVCLASERLRNSRDSDGNKVLVMMLSIMRPPESGSSHFETI